MTANVITPHASAPLTRVAINADTPAMPAAKKPQSPAMAFLVDQLTKNRKAAYSDIKAKADNKNLKLFPIMFGRAQAMLGIVKSAKRGTGKFAKASAAKAAGTGGRPVDASSKSGRIRALLGSGMSVAEIAKKVGCSVQLVHNVKSASGKRARRGPGRPRKNTSAGIDGLEGILAAVKSADRERSQMRGALERIQGIIGNVLG